MNSKEMVRLTIPNGIEVEVGRNERMPVIVTNT